MKWQINWHFGPCKFYSIVLIFLTTWRSCGGHNVWQTSLVIFDMIFQLLNNKYINISCNYYFLSHFLYFSNLPAAPCNGMESRNISSMDISVFLTMILSHLSGQDDKHESCLCHWSSRLHLLTNMNRFCVIGRHAFTYWQTWIVSVSFVVTLSLTETHESFPCHLLSHFHLPYTWIVSVLLVVTLSLTDTHETFLCHLSSHFHLLIHMNSFCVICCHTFNYCYTHELFLCHLLSHFHLLIHMNRFCVIGRHTFTYWYTWIVSVSFVVTLSITDTHESFLCQWSSHFH